MCLNGTYPFLSATLVWQLPYYLFCETCFMNSCASSVFFCFGEAAPPLYSLLCRECVLPLRGGLRAGRPTISRKRDYVVGAAYMPPAPPLPKAMPAGLYFTSFNNPSPLANARAFSIVVMAMLCNAVRVKNA